jgi:CRISPR type IV-associated protein Csf3
MLENWKLTIHLNSQISDKPPMLESLLTWELSRRLGFSSGEDLSKSTPIENIREIGLPICKKTIAGVDVFQCSNPIYHVEHEYHEHQAKSFEGDKMAMMLDERERKSLLVASGPYKMRFVPVRTLLIPKVVYFFRGDRKEVSKLLKSVTHIGRLRSIGYGRICHYEFKLVDYNYSIFADDDSGYQVLMRTIPYVDDQTIKGARKSFGPCKPPYWHPDNYMEVLEPC